MHVGGALAAGTFALFQSHPLEESKPLLDLEIALVLLPSILLGVTVGEAACSQNTRLNPPRSAAPH